jgi:NAD(P)-dependent dehydrogenase (short-subunit alcohol dehydrogenase family)
VNARDADTHEMAGDRTALCGRVAVVTGAGGGIGSATCVTLARRGARIVAVDIDAARLDTAVQMIEAVAPGSAPVALELDVSREDDADTMARETMERCARIDVLVTAAGVLRGPGGKPCTVSELTLAEWEHVLRANLRGVFLSNRAVLPAMVRQGAGEIVNISSTSGLRGLALDAPYCASKFGVIALSEALADEVRSHGVRVQVLVPPAVDTPLWRQNGSLFRPSAILEPDRVANLIAFLITLPSDMSLANPTVTAVATRRRTSVHQGVEA